MRPFVWLTILLCVAGFARPALALDEATARQVMANAVDGYIRPAYKDFHDKAGAMASETGRLCAAPSADGLKAVRSRFADTVVSWGHIEFLREGSVMRENRLERILFYPDRKSIGLRQVQALLAEPDETVTEAAGLKGRSVAIQGLGAFEFLLFGTDNRDILSEKNSFRCRYAMAIAKNVETIAGELQAAWDAPDGVARDWKNPSADNPVYRDGTEAASALIGVAVHGLEMVRDQRIAQFYKGDGGKVRPKSAVFRRAGLTMTALVANVEGLAKFWEATDMALLLDPGMRSLSDSVSFDFDAALNVMRTLEQPTEERLEDERYRGKLDFVEFNLKDAMTRIDSHIGGAIGLGAGFSFADGD